MGEERPGAVPDAASTWQWLVLPLAMAAVLAGPMLMMTSAARARAGLRNAADLVRLPAGSDDWTGPNADARQWQPAYHGGLAREVAAYLDAEGVAVDVFVAVYGLGTSVGDEMISYGNVITPREHDSVVRQEFRTISLPGGAALEVRDLTVTEGLGARRVWQWFQVGDRTAVNEFSVKAMEASAFLSRNADSERIITVSTIDDPHAEDRLMSFVQAHLSCVKAGFSGPGCSE